jgi:transcriptional regulator with XRE-family HTH domain
VEPSSSSAELGRLVKLRRNQAGATQTDLANLMTGRGHSWHQSTVNRIENGQRPITWDEAVTLASILDIDLSQAARSESWLLDKLVELSLQRAETDRQYVAYEQQLHDLRGRDEGIRMWENVNRPLEDIIADHAAATGGTPTAVRRVGPKKAAKSKKPNAARKGTRSR